MKVKFPTLYKKTSTGAIQFWDISVDNNRYGFGRIETSYGQVGTESPQVTEDFIEIGKNIGKINETTPYEQAQSEAKSKWEKQKKKGYVETLTSAKNDELDDLIEGGIVPMLAHKFSDHGHKIVYPAFVQPKLDGIRCIAILKNGECTLWSRTRKQITSVPHIVAALEKLSPELNMIFDGELYNHEFKKDFEKIVSMVRQEEPAPGHEIVQYHVYDFATDNKTTFRARAAKLVYMKDRYFNGEVVKVQTVQVDDESAALDYFQLWRGQGYEGAMIRNGSGLYANKRSYDLQKIKEFDDAEFKIIGIDEGRGKLAGHVGAFVCLTSDGKEFLAKMSGDTEKLKEYFENHKLWKGKQLTVKFQGLTGTNGVPRFPVGVLIRDYE